MMESDDMHIIVCKDGIFVLLFSHASNAREKAILIISKTSISKT